MTGFRAGLLHPSECGLAILVTDRTWDHYYNEWALTMNLRVGQFPQGLELPNVLLNASGFDGDYLWMKESNRCVKFK